MLFVHFYAGKTENRLQLLCGPYSCLHRLATIAFDALTLLHRVYSWNLVLLRRPVGMQHYDKRGQYDLSLSKIDEDIEHTPTVIDLYSAKVG